MATNENTVEAFLAREKEELAGIDDEFGALTTADQPSVTAPATATAQKAQNGAGAIDFFDDGDFDFEKPTINIDQNGSMDNGDHVHLNGSSKSVDLTNGSSIFNDDSNDGDGAATIPMANTLSALPIQQQNAMRRVATPTPPPTREEPAKIKSWRENQRERLEKKDAREEEEKKKLRDQAKRELADWCKKRNEQLENAAKRNRSAEQELMAQRDSPTPGQEWERVSGMIDFNPKSARAAKDLTRFRSILLQMKNQPQKAGK